MVYHNSKAGKDRIRPSGKGKFLIFVGLVLIMAGGGLISILLTHEIREITGSQFNEQQLIIARHARKLIERELEKVRRELIVTASRIESRFHDTVSLEEELKSGLVRVSESGVRQVDLLDFNKLKRYSITSYEQSLVVKEMSSDQSILTRLESIPEGAVLTAEPEIIRNFMAVSMVAPLGDRPNLYLRFSINTAWLVRPFLRNIRSGKTGYAWIIDGRGVFHYHQENSFIGKSAFEARKEKNPDISFNKIDFIQREKMLKGVEGTGLYYSGWHRGVTGLVCKFIAYTPVRISDFPDQTWSVAVVAPVSEIEGRVRRVFLWQFALQAIVCAFLILAAFSIFYLERKWSRELGRRVKKRTDDLARSEDRYRLLLESAEDYIFTVDREYCLESMNTFTANFFGGRPNSMAGREFTGLFPREQAERNVKPLQMVFRTGKSFRAEYNWRPGAEAIWVDANFMPLKDEKNKVDRVLCIARDITEQKKLIASLIESEKLASIGTLAAGVAHEINNPLGVILGFVDLLLNKIDPADLTYEDLKIIERQGLNCKTIVENLLSFSRNDESHYDFCDLNRCIIDILQFVRHNLEKKHIEITESYEEGLPLIRGDSRKIQQVFLNLVNNSAGAVKDGGHIRIATRYDRLSGKAVAEVSDNGHGIKPEHGEHIFEPFFTTKPDGEGTGLGLFICYGIVTRYGGNIDWESRTGVEGEGASGAVFTLRFQTFSEV